MKRSGIFLYKAIVICCLALVSVIRVQAQITIEMDNRDGVFYLNGKVNDIPLEFIFDTGASSVLLSLTEANFMAKNGYLLKEDVQGLAYSQVANGDIEENLVVNLRTVEIGGIVLHDVKATISSSVDAPILFGQSAIQKLGPIQLDGNLLIIANGKNFKSEEIGASLFQKAFQAAESKDYNTGISLSEEALTYTTNPEMRSSLYDNIAFCYYGMDNLNKAIEAENLALGEYLMAEQPGYNLGVYQFEAGLYEDAKNSLKKFIIRHEKTALKSMVASAYAYLGDCNSRFGEVKEAEMNYKASISKEPYSQAYFGLADLYYNTEDYNKAAINYKKGLEYEPNRPSNINRYCQLGLSYAYMGQRQDAYDSFTSCKQLYDFFKKYIDEDFNSDNDEVKDTAAKFTISALTSEMWLARCAPTPEASIKQYLRIKEIPLLSSRMTSDDFFRMLVAYSNLGEDILAERVIEEAYGLFPNDPNIMFLKTTIMPEGDAARMDILNKILDYEYSVTPYAFDYGTVYNNIAWGYCLKGEYAKGLPYAKTAVKKNPEHGYSWETLGELYYYTGDYTSCIDAMTKVLECDDGQRYEKTVYEFRGNSLMRLGNKKEGRKELSKARQL